MVMTPWGAEEKLRERTLRHGPRLTAAAAQANRRERLQGAMVAACARDGYREVTVTDLTEIAGVSRRDFYRLFPDKEACFLATVEDGLALARTLIAARLAAATDAESGAEEALDEFFGLVTWQPAAARLCLLESYAAGPAARAAVERGTDALEGVITDVFASLRGPRAMPAQLVRGIVGAIYKIVHTRLHEGREGELAAIAPQLLSWGLAYEPPTAPLRWVDCQAAPSTAPRLEPDPLLGAVAAVVSELGFDAATGQAIVERAAISNTTFYGRFSDKERATLAAIEWSGEQMLAATLPLVEAAPDWPAAVRTAFVSMCGLAAASPAFGRLRAAEVYAIGAEAVALRDRGAGRLLAALTAPGRGDAPAAEPIVLEAIAGAIYALLYDQAIGRGPASPLELVPVLTYLALAPFLGAEEATRRANGANEP